MTALAIAFGVVGLSHAYVLGLAFRLMLIETRRLDDRANMAMSAAQVATGDVDDVRKVVERLRDELTKLDNRTRTVVGGR